MQHFPPEHFTVRRPVSRAERATTIFSAAVMLFGIAYFVAQFIRAWAF